MTTRTSSNSRTRVGKYELGRTLGEGTFAKVKFARNVETQENVAIKILDKEKVLKHKMISQIKREISTMKLIKHPNVIRMFEVMASKTKIYIVLEFVTGGELFDNIARRGRLKEDDARTYFHQLINAVDYCHSRDANGVLKVSDFGLSALPQQVRADGLLYTACGTPNYVAPERITIAEILENEWFKKGYKPPKFEEADVTLVDVDSIFNESGGSPNLVVERREERPAAPTMMNAFQLISTSQGLDLSCLFEKQMGLVKRETRFTSKSPANEIVSKIEEAALPLGFDVKKTNNKIKLLGEKPGRKGHLAVTTEILQVAPSVCMVELRKSGGDTLEFHKGLFHPDDRGFPQTVHLVSSLGQTFVTGYSNGIFFSFSDGCRLHHV
ncbi:hypothetical protein CXB51_027290 [Gossypium anomalum]|uniref:non-specific serine/threonine protein kinase n=1 Tax=Gossypium anomalum TaxID=47600 RepID=A0A8J5Y5D6_9ROSI|nr:hypothetical protein CXB51_027290 [Gossypium anomalum]